jgi:hypothetical protein
MSFSKGLRILVGAGYEWKEVNESAQYESPWVQSPATDSLMPRASAMPHSGTLLRDILGAWRESWTS